MDLNFFLRMIRSQNEMYQILFFPLPSPNAVADLLKFEVIRYHFIDKNILLFLSNTIG